MPSVPKPPGPRDMREETWQLPLGDLQTQITEFFPKPAAFSSVISLLLITVRQTGLTSEPREGGVTQ